MSNWSGLPAEGRRYAGLLATPLVLALDLCLGGSPRNAFITNGALEVTACLIIIWCTIDLRFNLMSTSARWFLAIVGGLALVALLQLVPLPPGLWTHLPGRSPVAVGFAAAHVSLTGEPLSLAPEETVYALLRFLPPIAIFMLDVCANGRPLG